MTKSKRSLLKKELDFNIVWHDEAVTELNEIENYIFQFSVQGAELLVGRILSAVDSLRRNPERFQRDKELNSEFRRVIVSQYKIVFDIKEENKTVKILSVWNTKWNPQKFLKIAKR
ncbi:MAG TPA: type II toxin-antitoxin system RelE/ParE family toxin [Chitinophagales bacterium]|nr:type II toxin-antitoxin system RelE/ParE family toxin [Chitinophagales bacterium]HLP49650.1 type II toxin-antitoxin system RelE/ParE family toxin [Chitinophagales bacterium]